MMSSTDENLTPSNTPTPPNNIISNGFLLFIFVCIALFLGLLIAIASAILFCMCFCKCSSKSKIKAVDKGKELALDQTKDEESLYEVIQSTTTTESIHPQELLAYALPETFYPLPLPVHVSHRNSFRFREGYYEEPRPIMGNYIEPIDTLNRTSSGTINPYNENLDDLMYDHMPSNPLPPPRYPTLTGDVDPPDIDSEPDTCDEIYTEPLEPSMLSTNHSATAVPKPQEALPYAPIYDVTKSKLTRQLFHIPSECVRIIQELGNGHFGKVYLAATINVSLKDLQLSDDSDRSRSILVAVKQLSPLANSDLKESFHKEIKFMSQLKHANVVRLLAVNMSDDVPFITIEYMENGDLNEFLQKQALCPNTTLSLGEKEITPVVLLYITVQVASGMRYLASKKFIHRDLATRNCLVGRDFVTKVADFGMSRNFHELSYYRVAGQLILPIRWMATETYYGRFSMKSDAWAFGVLVWEIFTLCRSLPYSDMSDDEVIADAISGEKRRILSKPSDCPDEVYNVLCRCFVHSPSERADFEEIYSHLFVAYTSLSQKMT